MVRGAASPASPGSPSRAAPPRAPQSPSGPRPRAGRPRPGTPSLPAASPSFPSARPLRRDRSYSGSISAKGDGRPEAPARSAPSTYSSISNMVRTSTRVSASAGSAQMRRVASMPVSPGIWMSMTTTSGRTPADSATTSTPSAAWPTTVRSGSAPMSAAKEARRSARSSAMGTRMGPRANSFGSVLTAGSADSSAAAPAVGSAGDWRPAHP